MTGVGFSWNSLSLAITAGLSLARATDSAPLPGTEILKKWSALDNTLKGPVYGEDKQG